MDDVAEFVESVAGELVESVLENTVMEMAWEVACKVCFEEDAPDVWSFGAEGQLEVCFLLM